MCIIIYSFFLQRWSISISIHQCRKCRTFYPFGMAVKAQVHMRMCIYMRECTIFPYKYVIFFLSFESFISNMMIRVIRLIRIFANGLSLSLSLSLSLPLPLPLILRIENRRSFETYLDSRTCEYGRLGLPESADGLLGHPQTKRF